MSSVGKLLRKAAYELTLNKQFSSNGCGASPANTAKQKFICRKKNS